MDTASDRRQAQSGDTSLGAIIPTRVKNLSPSFVSSNLLAYANKSSVEDLCGDDAYRRILLS